MMEKHFVASNKSYVKLKESLSDTETKHRRTSSISFDELQCDIDKNCSAGDGIRKVLSKKISSGRSEALKIRDEVKIDLGKFDTISNESRSKDCFVKDLKIYPIDEVSENTSRASSKMRADQYEKQQEVFRILEESRRKAKSRPRTKVHHSSTQVNVEDIARESKTFYESLESSTDSLFKKDVKCGKPSTSYSSLGSLESFKKAQLNRLISESTCFLYNQSKTVRDPELLSIRTYSSQPNSNSTTCFGCLSKSLSNLCRRKVKKR
ncbi:CLUMA_CG014665, isoform A [Clunio marinus]|uniref:CLUMA_CG014665, isoform A n=1 Tax=Clunio marinus TaxID=568069 RepID=A0A1J1IMY5_9DIPT|nr:CLUMA_CG014665, isoform A [Clunio marinus]